jgi:S-DNA-T family DNA segregation ATPase FtsK/SpoIIIE
LGREPSAKDIPTSGGVAQQIAFGLNSDTMSTLAVQFHPGEHLAVVGPARSGRTTTLATIAESAIGQGFHVSILAARPWAPEAIHAAAVYCDEAGIPGRVEQLEGQDRRHLVVVDEAEFFDDTGGHLARLVERPPPGCHIVLSTRAEQLRTGFRHWSVGVRRSRHALLLRPDETDGDLFGTRLDPRVEIAQIPGRGVYLRDGTLTVCQVAAADYRG